jgi:tRNA modification GTPase
MVIAGRPNAGKSSLFNLLLREERSIVTGIPGTTRDWIESWIAIEGIPIRLADTAGLHATEDPVERLGMERSRELLDNADLVLYLIDGSQGLTGEDQNFFRDYPQRAEKRNQSPAPVIPLWNKADIAALPKDLPAALSGTHPLGISAKTGAGIPELTASAAAALARALGEKKGGPENTGEPGIATARQKELIDAARDAVEEALVLESQGQTSDLIAPLLREGVDALGEITGEVSTAEILETMFSSFCVGK